MGFGGDCASGPLAAGSVAEGRGGGLSTGKVNTVRSRVRFLARLSKLGEVMANRHVASTLAALALIGVLTAAALGGCSSSNSSANRDSSAPSGSQPGAASDAVQAVSLDGILGEVPSYKSLGTQPDSDSSISLYQVSDPAEFSSLDLDPGLTAVYLDSTGLPVTIIIHPISPGQPDPPAGYEPYMPYIGGHESEAKSVQLGAHHFIWSDVDGAVGYAGLVDQYYVYATYGDAANRSDALSIIKTVVSRLP